MVIGNERIQIMKETNTSLDRKINSSTSTRLGYFSPFVISEVFKSWLRGIQ